MQKTNISDRISQRKYFLARLSKQCLQVHSKHSGQLQISQLASTMSCLPQCTYPIQSLARIEKQLASYQLTQYAQVKVRQPGTQIKLVCQLARQHTTPQQSFTIARHVARAAYRYQRYVALSLVTFSQLASQLPNLTWLLLGGLARSQSS